ncbi:hypothetical protein FQZ97_936230 [compost metagenome]
MNGQLIVALQPKPRPLLPGFSFRSGSLPPCPLVELGMASPLSAAVKVSWQRPTAGHRPCAQCRRGRYNDFQAAWASAFSIPTKPSASEMDKRLHAARLDDRGEKKTWLSKLWDLPDGTMFASDGRAFLVWTGRQWSVGGVNHRLPALLVRCSGIMRLPLRPCWSTTVEPCVHRRPSIEP